MPIIQVENLRKNYDYYEKGLGLKGSISNIFHRQRLTKEAVRDISFTVDEGEIVGFIGPNGAGKTTTLKMLSGILFPTSGTATVNGFVPWERRKSYKMNMSIVMGQKSQLNWDLPASETFYLNKCIYELGDAEYKAQLDRLIGLLDVEDILKIQVRRLSLGERMKMELIAALIHSPRIVFLDEPTIGLDLVSQQSIREFIRQYNRETGATVILTSHYMADIESLCRRSVIINDGHIVYDGALGDINAELNSHKILRLQCTSPIGREALSRFGSVVELDGLKAVIEVERDGIRACARDILDKLPVLDFTIEDTPIENAIARFYGKEGG